ncbi:ABC transporter permease [Jiangella sp. DSM 45060]|uniref:ABC transporter permease n=1 Tax=Jiangella sp. DSM 45060 TaxID=1798224 RepID=UPI0008798F7F|nr:ABC transporter permease [Jiangella sp. DSM 45060]SDT15857.1 peptide/nickel transport system permease protein [Jiangella sp. DSM 45060]
MTEAAVTAPRQLTRRRTKSRPPLLIGLCLGFMTLVLIVAIFGEALAPQDPSQQDVLGSLAPPSAEHWLGTDGLGRDVFSRMLAGARSAIMGPLVIAVVAMVCGNLLGLLAGYRAGLVDSLLMRWVDLMVAIPSLLIIIVVAGALGGGYWLAVALLTVLTIPTDARVMRAATLEQVPRPYVEAAKTLGVSNGRIMVRHIWPNIAATAVANSVIIFAGSLVAIAGLSFLGLGAEPGTPDWGQMLSENQPLLFTNPVASIAPGIAIALTATAVNLIGDWVYEKMSRRGAAR